jgi:putative ABC transport system permease protein
MIKKLIWRNLWRNKRRSVITIASIAFAVMFTILMQSFQRGVFDHLIKSVVGNFTGYIKIFEKNYWEEKVLDNSFEWNETLEKTLTQHSNINKTVARIESFVLASNENLSTGCLIVGTDPEKENAFSRLKERMIDGAYLNNNDEAAVIAQGIANKLGLKVNDTIVLFGQGYHGSMAAGKFPVKGIVKLASPDMNSSFVYLPLQTAQYFLSAESMLTSISIGLKNPKKMEETLNDIKKKLGNSYDIKNWEEMMPDIKEHIKAEDVSAYIFSGILYMIITFGLLGTIIMMLAERKYEFGMLVAIGMKKSKMQLMLIGETLMLSILGVLSGMIISLPIVMLFNFYPIQFTGDFAAAYEQFGFEAVLPTIVDANIFITQSSIVLILSLIIGLYPLWHIKQLDPINAMKK